jgi:hypothetical protein
MSANLRANGSASGSGTKLMQTTASVGPYLRGKAKNGAATFDYRVGYFFRGYGLVWRISTNGYFLPAS